MRFSILPIFLLSLASSVLAAPSAINDAADLSARSAEEVDVDKRTFSQLTCPRGWNKGLFKCCPPGAFDILGQCKCLDIRTTLSRDGQRCENKCSQSDWKWCNTQCCPPGSDENRWGQCECSGNKQLVGSGNNKRCVDKCDTGRWCDTRCCPHGSSEKHGQCVCDSDNQQLSRDGKKCEDRCPSGFNWSGGQCCPPGSIEKNNQCQCTDRQKEIIGSGNDRKCDYNCPSGTEPKGNKHICCPHDSFEVNGKCQCSDHTKTLSKDGLRCESACPKSGEKYSNGICCKSHLTNKGGQCACPTDGQIDNGSSCSPCPSDKNYNWVHRTCDPACPPPKTYKVTRQGNGVCCSSGSKPCETVCCPQDKEEVGHSGKCCKPGSTLDAHGNCLEPTYVPNPHQHKRQQRRDTTNAGLIASQIQLAGSAFNSYFGLDSNINGDLCPPAMAACPIEGAAKDEYECLDTRSDLQSCGGCASLGEGKDCTLITGAKWMGCVQGQCEVYSCTKGHKLVDGACIKA